MPLTNRNVGCSTLLGDRLMLEEGELRELPGGGMVAEIEGSDKRAKHVKKIIKVLVLALPNSECVTQCGKMWGGQ